MINRWTLYIIQRPVSAIVFHDGVLDTTKLSSHFWPLKSREKDIRSRGLFIGLVQNWRVAGLNAKYTNMYHIQTCIKYIRSSYHKRVFMNLCIYRDLDYCNSHIKGIFKNVDYLSCLFFY